MQLLTRSWTRSIYVRHRLTPLLSKHGASLVLSGHQHAYSRGFLPHSLHKAFTSAHTSASLPTLAKATVRERGWEKTSAAPGVIDQDGTVYVIAGGAGGTLDFDRVEDWGFYDASVSGRHHFGWIGLGFAGGAGETGRVRLGDGAKRVYRFRARRRCADANKVTDVLEWRAVGLDGKAFDAFRIEADGCVRSEAGV